MRILTNTYNIAKRELHAQQSFVLLKTEDLYEPKTTQELFGNAKLAPILELPIALKSMRAGERERDSVNNVNYFSKNQRCDYQLKAKDGKLFKNNSSELFDTSLVDPDKSLLYVISRKGKIYAARGSRHVVHHSSLLSGKEVMAAGKIMTQDGKVIYINNNSGHYRPTARHLFQAILYFNKLDILSPNVCINIRHEGNYNLKDGLNILRQMVEGERQSNSNTET